ncbi:hypothetical protein J4223_03800 [Candidatus Woesearchaeota archaeon]|nr:hypothetical protein [Candidatus Woesearchaeota archaeon]
MQDDDVANLFDGTITFQSKEYDTSEELQMVSRVNPVIGTSLTSSDDDYKSDVYLEVNNRDVIKFAYKFDESINLSLATSSDPLNIEFLGNPLKVTSVPSTHDRFTAYVGEEHYLSAGESFEVEISGVTKTITLQDVSSTSAVVDVDGTSKIITDGSTSTVNGVEITVDDVFSRTERAESSANIIVGVQSAETYLDGDAFIGENTDEPNWVWNLEGLATKGTAQNFSIENDFVYDDEDDAVVVGSCIDLPNDYVQICFDSLSVAAEDYATYTFEIDTEDLSLPIGTGNESVKVVRLATTVSEGIELLAYSSTNVSSNDNVTSTVRVKEVWLYTGSSGAGEEMGDAAGSLLVNNKWIGVFYKDSADSKVKLYGQVNASASGVEILRINYGNTKDTNIQLETVGYKAMTSGQGTEINLSLDIIGDSTSGDLWEGYDDIKMNWGLTAVNGSFESLGDTAATEEGSELTWGNQSALNIGAKDEDHRTAYGIIISDPKSSSSSDKVVLSIPQDQVKANIVIKGTSSTVSSGDVTYVPVQVTPVTKFASEVSSASAYNLILVGGPCANALVEDLFDMTCESWAYAEGEAVIKLAENGDKVAMLVAGTSGEDTRRAAKALLSYSDYDFSGSEVMVSGTSLEDINVEAI